MTKEEMLALHDLTQDLSDHGYTRLAYRLIWHSFRTELFRLRVARLNRKRRKLAKKTKELGDELEIARFQVNLKNM